MPNPTAAELLQAAEVLDAKASVHEYDAKCSDTWLNSPERLLAEAAALRSVAAHLRLMATGVGEGDSLSTALLRRAAECVTVLDYESARLMQQAAHALPQLERRCEELEADRAELADYWEKVALTSSRDAHGAFLMCADQIRAMPNAGSLHARLPALERRCEELEATASKWILRLRTLESRHLRTVQAAHDAIRRERERRVRAEEYIEAFRDYMVQRAEWKREMKTADKERKDAAHLRMIRASDAWEQTRRKR